MPKNSPQDRIEAFKKKKDNSKCAICDGYVDTVLIEFSSFVCHRCSGFLRESGFTVKGIKMTNWNEKDADRICSGGNQREKEDLCGKWNGSEMAVHQDSDENSVRAFIRAKYVDKRWQGAGGGGGGRRDAGGGGDTAANAQQIIRVFPNLNEAEARELLNRNGGNPDAAIDAYLASQENKPSKAERRESRRRSTSRRPSKEDEAGFGSGGGDMFPGMMPQQTYSSQASAPPYNQPFTPPGMQGQYGSGMPQQQNQFGGMQQQNQFGPGGPQQQNQFGGKGMPNGMQGPPGNQQSQFGMQSQFGSMQSPPGMQNQQGGAQNPFGGSGGMHQGGMPGGMQNQFGQQNPFGGGGMQGQPPNSQMQMPGSSMQMPGSSQMGMQGPRGNPFAAGGGAGPSGGWGGQQQQQQQPGGWQQPGGCGGQQQELQRLQELQQKQRQMQEQLMMQQRGMNPQQSMNQRPGMGGPMQQGGMPNNSFGMQGSQFGGGGPGQANSFSQSGMRPPGGMMAGGYGGGGGGGGGMNPFM